MAKPGRVGKFSLETEPGGPPTKEAAPVQYRAPGKTLYAPVFNWTQSEIPFYFDPAVDDMTDWEIVPNALGTKVRLKNTKTGAVTKEYSTAEYQAFVKAIQEGKVVGSGKKMEVSTGTGLPGFEGVKYGENGEIIGYNPVNMYEFTWNKDLGVQQSMADKNIFAGYRYNPEFDQSKPQSAENKAYLWTSTGTELNRYGQPAGTSAGVYGGVGGPRSRSGGSVNQSQGIPDYAVQDPLTGGWSWSSSPGKESMTGWGGQGFKDLRNKRRAVWEQRNQAAGKGLSGQAAGRMVSWNP